MRLVEMDTAEVRKAVIDFQKLTSDDGSVWSRSKSIAGSGSSLHKQNIRISYKQQINEQRKEQQKEAAALDSRLEFMKQKADMKRKDQKYKPRHTQTQRQKIGKRSIVEAVVYRKSTRWKTSYGQGLTERNFIRTDAY